MTYPHILAEIARTPWAIAPEALRGILSAVNGDASERTVFHGASQVEQVVASTALGQPRPGSKFSHVRGDVGAIQINGPIVPRADGMEAMSGALASVDRLTAEFEALDADPAIRRIALIIDSPGGAVTGISEFATRIRAASKPVVAYVYGHAASAAYWIASAASEIYTANTSLVGSIGVVMSLERGEADKVEIVSSQSPDKRPDLDDDAAFAKLQPLVDGLASIFIDTVAANRNTTSADVIKNFGRGGMLLPTDAARVGMIDGVMTLAEFVARQAGETPAQPTTQDDLLDSPDFTGHNRNNGGEPHKSEAMMNLSELLKEHPEAKADLDAVVATAGEKAIADHRASTAQAAKILASDEYPTSIKAIASAVLAGTKSLESLETAVSVLDALRADKQMDTAKAESEKVPATPAQTIEPLSTDGVLRSAADIDAAAAKLKAGR